MKKSYEDAVKELTLMLMYLTRHQENNEYCRYRELSWKGYDFDVMEKLEEEDLLWQPRNRKGYNKYLYLTEDGRSRAKDLLMQYGFSDKAITEKFDFRTIRPEETEQAVRIEQICFPPNEACSEKDMKDRIVVAADLFLVAVDKATGNIAGFLNGIATNEYAFRDEFFTVASLHDANGKNIMILGLDVLPEYRNRGLAHEIVYQYLRRESDRDRKSIILTCLDDKVKFYEEMGFADRGIAASIWGGEEWHEMVCVIQNTNLAEELEKRIDTL